MPQTLERLASSNTYAEYGNASSRDVLAEPGSRVSSNYVRPLLAGGLLIAGVVLAHLTPARQWIGNVDALRDATQRAGIWTYPLAFFATAILVGLGVPRLLLCALAGALFAFWIALPITLLGSVLGHWCVFRIIRWGGRDWAMHRWPTLSKWTAIFHGSGTMGVIVARLLPAHALLINLALGLSPVKNRHFLVGSLIGLLPEGIAATLLGAGLINASLSRSVGVLALAMSLLLLIAFACRNAAQSFRPRGEPQDFSQG